MIDHNRYITLCLAGNFAIQNLGGKNLRIKSVCGTQCVEAGIPPPPFLRSRMKVPENCMKRKIYASRSNELLSWVNKEYLLKRFPLQQVNFNFGLSEGGGSSSIAWYRDIYLQMIMLIVKFITE